MERQAVEAVDDATAQIEFTMEQWSLASVVKSLLALRGIDKLDAVTLLTEFGDISHFPSPEQLMSFLGLVPAECWWNAYGQSLLCLEDSVHEKRPKTLRRRWNP